MEASMCYRVRDADAERQRAQQSLPPSEMNSPRPRRLVGALAAVAAAVVAAVALLFPASTPAVSTSTAAPVVPVVEQSTGGMDDGVPASTAGRAGASRCDREL
jgi:hypothetical protein